MKTVLRARPDNAVARVVRAKGFKNSWPSEDVAEFEHRPDSMWPQAYRVIRPGRPRWKWARTSCSTSNCYFLHHQRPRAAEQIALLANDCCDQEKPDRAAQERRAMHPLDNLMRNWAYMVMAGLAWTPGASRGLLLPADARPPAIRTPRAEVDAAADGVQGVRRRKRCCGCRQIVRTGRRIVHRLLAGTWWAQTLIRLSQAMRLLLRC